MFDRNTLLQHMQNTSDHKKMTQAGVKTGFGLREDQRIKKKEPKKPNYEVIKEADYV